MKVGESRDRRCRQFKHGFGRERAALSGTRGDPNWW